MPALIADKVEPRFAAKFIPNPLLTTGMHRYEAVAALAPDGVPEALSPTGEAFGYQPWPELLPSLCRRPPEAILKALLATVEDHRAGRPPRDDLTAVVVKVPARE